MKVKLISNLFIQHRLNKAIAQWNNDLPYINACIKEYDDKYPPGGKEENYKPSRAFYWGQLVLQEIKMYIRLDEEVTIAEFTQLCTRRGLALKEQNYLQLMLQYVGLMK